MVSLYQAIRTWGFRQIFIAQTIHKPGITEFDLLHTTFYSCKPLNIEKSKVQIGQIEAAIATKGNTELYDPNKMYVIRVDGNNLCYEQSLDFITDVVDDRTNVVVFNPPGVGHSKGEINGPEDIKKSLRDVIEHLRSKGVPYERMTLSGYSFGGGIATNVAAEYQRKNARIKLINERSYSDLGTCIGEVMKNNVQTKLLRTIFGNALYFVYNGLINAFNLNIRADKDFAYINNKNPGDAHCITVNDDMNIPEVTNLYNSLPLDMRNKYATRFSVTTTNLTPHFASYSYLKNENNPQQNAATYVHNIVENMIENQDSHNSHSIAIKLINTIQQSLTRISMNDKKLLRLSTKSRLNYDNELSRDINVIISLQKELQASMAIDTKVHSKIDRTSATELIELATDMRKLIQIKQTELKSVSQRKSFFISSKRKVIPTPENIELTPLQQQIMERLNRLTS